jgi:predicted ATP-grasp superfamily ATP-dependent carboligase
MQDQLVWPVEINPRYTASVEILEYATGISALALHGKVFDPGVPEVANPTEQVARIVGKAILFAKDSFTFSEERPWLHALFPQYPIRAIPLFADIPHAGEFIERGKPVITLFACAHSAGACLDNLRRTAAALDRGLFSP